MAQDALLRPMPPDALLCKTGAAKRTAPQTAALPIQMASVRTAQPVPEWLAKPTAPPPSAQPDRYDPLAGLENLAPDLFADPDDDWPDDSEADAVPTSAMAIPVTVPLYDLEQKKRHTGVWIALCTLGVLAAAGFVLWRTGALALL